MHIWKLNLVNIELNWYYEGDILKAHAVKVKDKTLLKAEDSVTF